MHFQQEVAMNIVNVIRNTTSKERVALALTAVAMLAPLVPWNQL
jgi:hypothetical protein